MLNIGTIHTNASKAQKATQPHAGSSISEVMSKPAVTERLLTSEPSAAQWLTSVPIISEYNEEGALNQR